MEWSDSQKEHSKNQIKHGGLGWVHATMIPYGGGGIGGGGAKVGDGGKDGGGGSGSGSGGGVVLAGCWWLWRLCILGY